MPFYNTVPTEEEYIQFVTNITALPTDKIGADELRWAQTVAIIIGMFAMGLRVDLKIMFEILKRPWGVIIGLVCQFLIMPCIALVAIKTGFYGPYEALIIMLYGSCPGGGISNFFVYFLQLNVNLSVTMTNVSALLSFGFIPLWLLVIPSVVDDVEIVVPFKDIAVGVTQLIAPFIVGSIINLFFGKRCIKLSRCLAPISTFTIAVIVVLACLKYAPRAIFTPAQLVIAALMPLLGCLLGFSFAVILNFVTLHKANLNLQDCFTIGVETGIQNAQIAVTIVQMLYLDKPYIFAQQFFFPVICFAFQFLYWILCMFVVIITRLIQGRPLLGSSDADDTTLKLQNENPAFTEEL